MTLTLSSPYRAPEGSRTHRVNWNQNHRPVSTETSCLQDHRLPYSLLSQCTHSSFTSRKRLMPQPSKRSANTDRTYSHTTWRSHTRSCFRRPNGSEQASKLLKPCENPHAVRKTGSRGNMETVIEVLYSVHSKTQVKLLHLQEALPSHEDGSERTLVG